MKKTWVFLFFLFAATSVLAQPALRFSKDTLELFAVQGSSMVVLAEDTVSNVGSDTAHFGTIKTAQWISITPASGDAIAGRPGVVVTVGADPTNRPPTVLFDSIRFLPTSGSFPERRLYVKLTVVPATPGHITLSTDTLSFFAGQNGALPLPRNVTLSNTGGGIMSWFLNTLNPPLANWIAVTPASGTAPPNANLTVSITRTNLPPGVYHDTLRFLATTPADNSPQKIVVTYTVGNPQTAFMALNQTVFNFSAPQGGSAPPAQTLTIRNTGTGTMNWVINTSGLPTWLSPPLPPTGSVTGSEVDSVQLSASPGTLPAGNYSHVLQISSGEAINSPQSVTVNFTVTSITQPLIAVSDTLLEFSAAQGSSDPPSKSFTVSNVGGGTLNWTIFKQLNQPWLSVIPTTGTNTGTVSVSVTTGTKVPDVYRDTLLVSGNASNSPRKVAIRFTITAPPIAVLQVSPSALSFDAVFGQGNPAPKSLTILNGGPAGTTLNWSLVSDTGWLFPASASGTNTGNLNVSVSTANLGVGLHTGHFTITAPGAAGSPQTVAVTLNVAAPPVFISASPNSFSFVGSQGGSNPAARNLAINATDPNLSWNITKKQPWLSAVPSGGVGSGSVTVSVDITGLSQDDYFDTLVVNAAGAVNAPLRIAVHLSLGPALTPATLVVSPDSLVFEEPFLPQNIDISNGGQLPLNWNATVLNGSPWLSINPSAGTNAGSIVVTVDTSQSLAALRDTIKIEASGAVNSPHLVAVILRIPTDVVGGPGHLPRSYALFQNHPNPFNPSTEISFVLPRTEHATLEVFNVVGQRIRVLAEGELSAGKHTVTWDGRDESGRLSSSGIYFYRLKAANFSDIKRMVFLK